MSTQTKRAARSGLASRRMSRRRSGRPDGKLKPERIQLELRSMPGWRLVSGGNALACKRRFREAGAAARFAASVTDRAAAHGQPVILGVTGYQVTLTLRRPSRKGIDMALIDFARQID